MESTEVTPPIELVSYSNVEEWFRDAWKSKASYPDKSTSYYVATHINTIVEVNNNPEYRKNPISSIKIYRDILRLANKSARALGRDLEPVLEIFENKRKMRSPEGEVMQGSLLEDQISIVEALLTAIKIFEQLCSPAKGYDHQDPICWIAGAAEQGWDLHFARRTAEEQSTISFGKNPDSPLVSFVALALEAIGMPRSRETISDHLKGRHNRKRSR